jgi:hypothetical protein
MRQTSTMVVVLDIGRQRVGGGWPKGIQDLLINKSPATRKCGTRADTIG